MRFRRRIFRVLKHPGVLCALCKMTSYDGSLWILYSLYWIIDAFDANANRLFKFLLLYPTFSQALDIVMYR